jgi:hypothetical protein
MPIIDTAIVNYGKNWLLLIDQKKQHQHMSQNVLLMLISTFTTYACFESRTLSHDVLQRFMEIKISVLFYKKNCSISFHYWGVVKMA